MQIGRSTNGNVQVGNATVVSADVAALNGALQILDTFSLQNVAFNTSMVAALEAAGDFGPFNQSKVTTCLHFSYICCTYMNRTPTAEQQ